MNQLIEKTIELVGSDGVFEAPRVMVVGGERFFPGQIVSDLGEVHQGAQQAFIKDRASRFIRALLKERESTAGFNTTEVNMTKVVDRMLKTDFWPNRVTTNSAYSRASDVVDGTTMTVVFNDMDSGSIYINGRVAIFSAKNNPNIRKALLVLAEAIRADNEPKRNEEVEHAS